MSAEKDASDPFHLWALLVTDKKYDDVRMLLSSGTVKEFVAEPATIQTPDRIPVTDAHRRR